MSSLSFGLMAAIIATGVPDAPNLSEAAAPAESTASAVSAEIDRLFDAEWHARNVTPAATTSDAEFLRRVTLDLTGVIPEIGEARVFLADQRADKRTRHIDQLLQRPRHAAHLANVWREVLLPRAVSESAAAGFERWLQSQFAANVPYDTLAREVLLARGQLGVSPPTMYYAALQSKPSELAASSSRVFLGLQIRCAECHDHPFTDWKQDDFWGLAAFFARVTAPGGGVGLDDAPAGEVQHPKTMATVVPALLDGSHPVTDDSPRRMVFANWVTAPDNPYFARAAVNRAWSVLFGRGLVDPVDDFGDHNPATHPAVLDLLAADFREHGCDLRRTLRIIAGTRAYQLSSGAADIDAAAIEAYAAMPVRSLSAEQVYDCLIQAAGRRDPLERNDAALVAERTAFLAQIEAPTRQPTEFQGGIPQSLVLLNGPLVSRLTDPATGDRIAALIDSPFLNDAARVDALYLAALTRTPDDAERQAALEWIRADERRDPAQALGDLMWALFNSSEFILNH